MVLDDYHVVSNPVIHAGVDQLLVEAPAALRLVIATRHDPPLALSRLRSHGALRELRFDELRFDTDETAAVFGRIAGVTLPPLHAQRLVERTEGWVAAIQLVGLSAGVSDDPTTVVDAFTADHRHVFDYFRDEVITSLSDRLRAFLVDTAVLERLCAPLCDAVTGAADGQQILEELERRNLFVLPLDQRRRWFRYHHLFADWLRLHVDDPLPRHRAAADWLLANGYTGDAVRHLLAAGDTDRAAAVIEDQRWILIGQGRGKTLRDWVDQLPPAALRTRPGLTLAAAWAAHHAGDWDAVRDLAASIEPVDDLTKAEVLVLEAGRLIANDDADQALATVRAALPLVPVDEPRARTSLLLIQGRALLADERSRRCRGIVHAGAPAGRALRAEHRLADRQITPGRDPPPSRTPRGRHGRGNRRPPVRRRRGAGRPSRSCGRPPHPGRAPPRRRATRRRRPPLQHRRTTGGPCPSRPP